MFTHLLTHAESLLDCAQQEIKDSIRAIRKTIDPNDPDIWDLCTALEKRFSSVAKQFYGTSDAKPPNKQDSIYPYPTRYLSMFFNLSQDSCITILPYLLTAYYINRPINRVISPVDCAAPISEYSLTAEDVLFGDVDSAEDALPPNYTATLNSFCTHFSVKHLIGNFLRTKKTGYPKEVQQLKDQSSLIAYLNNGAQRQRDNCQPSLLHSKKTLQAFLYAVCTSCCASIPRLSGKIDYALSASLFNAHTLAFESQLNAEVAFCLKDWFSPQALSRTLDYLYAVDPAKNQMLDYCDDSTPDVELAENETLNSADNFALEESRPPV